MTKEQKGAAGSGSGSGTGSGSGCGAGAVVFDGRDYSEKSTAARTIRQVGGKDRHSKVVTWRGPRDRRIRLSVATAIQLYDVQDRLGYDQPSKAVEWLLSKAKPSIHALPLLHHPITTPTTLHYGKAKLEEEDEEEEEELASSSCEQPHLKSNTPPNVEPFLWTSPPNHLLHGLMQQSMNYNYPLPSSSSLSQVAMSRLDPFMPIPNGSNSVNNDLNGVQVQPIMSAHQLHNEHLLSLLKAPSLFHPTPSNSSSSTSRPDPLYRHLQNSSRLDNQAKGNNGSGYAACYSINSGSVEEQANSGSLMSALGIPHRSVHNSIHSNTSNITFLEHQLKQNSSSTTRYSTDLRHDGVGYIGQASNTATDVNNFDPRTFD